MNNTSDCLKIFRTNNHLNEFDNQDLRFLWDEIPNHFYLLNNDNLLMMKEELNLLGLRFKIRLHFFIGSCYLQLGCVNNQVHFFSNSFQVICKMKISKN